MNQKIKTVRIEHAPLDSCVPGAQRERIVITRGGVPVALMLGVDGLDEEQSDLGSSDEFWRLIAERRRQKTISLARKTSDEEGARPPMMGILPDNNVEAHMVALVRFVQNERWRDLWAGLELPVLTLDDLGLPRTSSDALMWQVMPRDSCG